VASRGTVQDVEHHIKNGVDVNVKNNSGNTPLHATAALNPDAAVVQYLIDQKADINARNKKYMTPMFFAQSSEKRVILKVAGGEE